MIQESLHSGKDGQKFIEAKRAMREDVKGHLDELDAKLKSQGKKVDRDKILNLFDSAVGGDEPKEKLVIRKNGTKILKDKSGDEIEKVKISRGKSLKIKDRNNKEVFKVDLEKDEVLRNTGDWLKDLKKEVEVVEKAPKIRNNAINLTEGEGGSYDLANDVVAGEVSKFSVAFPGAGSRTEQNNGKISFGKDLLVGVHEIKWMAMNGDKKSEVATLTVTVKEKEVVPVNPELEKKYKDSLSVLETSINSIEKPLIGVGKYNLDKVEAQIKIAEGKYIISQEAANVAGITDRSELIRLRKNLDDKIADLEQAEAKRDDEQEKIGDKMDELIKKEVEKKKRDDAEDKRVLDKMKSEMAETEANLAKTAAESFDKIKDGSFVNEIKETGFNPEELKTVEGLNFGLQKHSIAVQNYEKEVQIMGKGMEAMHEKQAQFEDKKSELLSGRNLGKVAGIGAVVGAGFLASNPVGWGVALVLGGATIAKNLAGAFYRRVGNPSPGSWLAHGSIMGSITGENKEAYAIQKEKLEFETKYDECSDKLKTKGELLKDQGEQLQGVDAQALVDNAIVNSVPDDFRTNLENLYKGVGLDPSKKEYSEIIDQKVLDLQSGIEAQNSAKLSVLNTSKSEALSHDQRVFDGDTDMVAYLAQSEMELDNMEFNAADIFDSTLGFAGKNLQKLGDVPVLGGVANAVGKLSEGFGGIFSRPDHLGTFLGGLVGWNTTRFEDGMSWGERLGNNWGNFAGSFVAAESWSEAGDKKGWEAVNAYINAGTETLTNFVALFFTAGGSGATAANAVSKFGRMSKYTARIESGAIRSYNVVRHPITTGRKISGAAKDGATKTRNYVKSKFGRTSAGETTKGSLFSRFKNWNNRRKAKKESANEGVNTAKKRTLKERLGIGRNEMDVSTFPEVVERLRARKIKIDKKTKKYKKHEDGNTITTREAKDLNSEIKSLKELQDADLVKFNKMEVFVKRVTSKFNKNVKKKLNKIADMKAKIEKSGNTTWWKPGTWKGRDVKIAELKTEIIELRKGLPDGIDGNALITDMVKSNPRYAGDISKGTFKEVDLAKVATETAKKQNKILKVEPGKQITVMKNNIFEINHKIRIDKSEYVIKSITDNKIVLALESGEGQIIHSIKEFRKIAKNGRIKRRKALTETDNAKIKNLNSKKETIETLLEKERQELTNIENNLKKGDGKTEKVRIKNEEISNLKKDVQKADDAILEIKNQWEFISGKTNPTITPQ